MVDFLSASSPAPASPDGQPCAVGPAQVGPYVLERHIGGGGMGEVFRAVDVRLDRPVALKRIRAGLLHRPRAAERFLREARAAAGLDHPNIVRVHDWLEMDGTWLVMEWIDGVALSHWLAGGPRSLVEVLELAADIASALEAAHQQGLVHRDLKARNVMIDGRGTAKLLDFGLAKRVTGKREASLTLEGQIVGTPYAMSPEQAMGRKVDHRTDFFSFGSLLYWLVTGIAPFRGKTPADSLGLVCARQPPAADSLVQVPERLSSLIEGLLEKSPARRPASAASIVEALRRSITEVGRMPDVPRCEASATEVTVARPTSGEALGRGGATTVSHSDSFSERRQLTVLCLRLVHVHAETGGPDLEALGDLPFTQLEDIARQTVDRFGGHVEPLGDDFELIACFGYPRIHEDDAERAVLAALELGEALAAALPTHLHLQARSTLHSGPAVVLGDDTGLLQVALGSTADRAQQQLFGAAEAGVWLSGETLSLLRRPFAAEAAGDNGLQKVIGPADSSAFWTGDGLIARDAEMELLLDRCVDAWRGSPHVVILRGDAGIGKSSLVAELRRRLESHGAEWWTLQGSAWASHSPLHPLLEPLRRHLALDLETETAMPTLVSALEARLGEDFKAPVTVPLFASLLGLPWQEHFPDLGWTAKIFRRRTFAALLELLVRSAEKRPLVLVVEDLHWIDSSTLEWLTLLTENLTSERLFIVATARPHFEAKPFEPAGGDRVTELRIDRLAAEEMAILVDRIVGGVTLGDEVRQLILDKAEGVPLFVEELTRSILESGQLDERDGVHELPDGPLALPATLESSIVARLDRLGSAKAVAQLAAVIGREFSHRLIEALSEAQGPELDRAISRLIEARFVHRRGYSLRRRYVFRHALVQDAAYDSLLRPQRRSLHQRIAGLLEEAFPQTARAQPELLAHHYTRAEVFDRAVDFWQQAGQGMFSRSAVVEAESHLEKGVSLIPRLAAGTARDRVELALQSTLGTVLATTEGFASARATTAYDRALALCSEFDGDEAQFWALKGVSQAYLSSARHLENLPICHRLMEWADFREEPVYEITARLALSAQLLTLGRFEEALEVADAGIAIDSLERRHHLAHQLSMDPGVNLVCMSGRILWFLGRTEEAFERIRLATEFSESIAHPGSTANVQHCAAALYYDLREPGKVLEFARRVIEISRRQGSFYEHWTRPLLWWAESMADRDSNLATKNRRRENFEEAIEYKRKSGFTTIRPQYLDMLSQLWLLQGQPERAFECSEEALRLIEGTGENLRLVDVQCARAEALLALSQGSSGEEGERFFRRAQGAVQSALEAVRDQKAAGPGRRALALQASIRRRAEPSAETRATAAISR